MDSHAIVVGRLPGVVRPAAPAGVEVAPRSLRRRKAMRVPRVIGKILLNIVFVAMIGCVVVMLGPALAGYTREVILTGSMTGTYNRGSIVYDKPVPTASLKVGDVITYTPPPGFTHQARESHRIWFIHRGPNGERIFKTKGDANKSPDVWTFELNRPTQLEVKFHVPEIGFLFLLLSIREFRLVIVGVPVLIIALMMIVKLWKEAGAEARRQKAGELGWRTAFDAGSGAVLEPVEVPATEQASPRLDLGLRTARAGLWGGLRAGRAGASAGAEAPVRQMPVARRIDLRRPLRVRPITPRQVAAVTIDAHGTPEPGQIAAGASIATLRLLVSRMTTRNPEPMAPAA
jgi:signal peptidase